MRLFCDNRSCATVGNALLLIGGVVLFYAEVYELAAAIGRQAGIW